MSEYVIYFALLAILIQVSRLNAKLKNIESLERIREVTNKSYWLLLDSNNNDKE